MLIVKNITQLQRDQQDNYTKYNFTEEMEKLLNLALDTNRDFDKPSLDGEVVYTNVMRKAFALIALIRAGKVEVKFADPDNFFIENLK